MEKSEKTREKIIEQTIELIKESDGDTEKVTIRKIAERSQISVGLVNHYFESKDILFEICVQHIIFGVISSFRPDVEKSGNRVEILQRVAKQVMDFLMDNQQISKISILGDLTHPKEMDNTMGTVLGFAGSVSDKKPSENDIKRAFMLTAILQESFLRKDILKLSLGVDFYDKSERDNYIDYIINRLMGNEEY